MTAPDSPHSDYIPLSQRPSEELLERAAELRQMAATATTEEVMLALRTLAERYAALAEKRLGGARSSR